MTYDPRLHPYQRAAADFLRHQEAGGALLLDMGLGKTAITLAALEPRHLPVLVVAPKRVAELVWPVEVPKWRPDLRVVLAAGGPARRAAALRDENADVVVLGRDNLADAQPVARRFRTLVLDELSGFKTPSATRTKAAVRLRSALGGPHVWGLTGTPTPNGLIDLYAQVGVLDGGRRLGTSKEAFLQRWYTLHYAGRPRGRRAGDDFDPMPPGSYREYTSSTSVRVWVPRPEAKAELFALLEDLCLAMATDGRIELPPVTRNVVDVEMPPLAQGAYRDLAMNMLTSLELLGGEVHTATSAAVLTNRLAQVTAGGLYVDDADVRGGEWDFLHDAKAAAVQEVVEGSSGGVVVAYGYRWEVDVLRKRLGKGTPVATLDEPGVLQRWDRGEVPVLALHPAAAGHGLNLQHGGHTIVWTTVPWSLEEWQQTNKRLPRQGQTQPVVEHVVRVPGTVDDLRMARIEGKALEQAELLGHLESVI